MAFIHSECCCKMRSSSWKNTMDIRLLQHRYFHILGGIGDARSRHRNRVFVVRVHIQIQAQRTWARGWGQEVWLGP